MSLNHSHLIKSAIVMIGLSALVGVGCGQSSSPTSPTSPSGSCTPTATNPECVNPPNLLTVTIKNGVYSPNPVTVKVGQSVNWLNSDSIPHSATDAGVFDTGSISPTSAHGDNGDNVTFNTVGTFQYHCMFHANETATVIVTQ
jgi:plastocyanin